MGPAITLLTPLLSVFWAPILAPARFPVLAYSMQVPGLKELTP